MFSPEGRRFAWKADDTGDDSVLATGSIAGSGMVPGTRLAMHGSINSISFSPDGRFLAASCEGGQVEVWNCATCRSIFRDGAGAPACYTIPHSWSPDGRFLAVGVADEKQSGPQGFSVYDLQESRRVLAVWNFDDPPPFAIGPDGPDVIAARVDETHRELQCYDARSGEVMNSVPLPYPADVLALSGDRKELVAASRGKVMVFGVG